MQVWCIDSKIQLLYSLVYLKMVHKDLHDAMFQLISLCGPTAVSFTRLLSDVTSCLHHGLVAGLCRPLTQCIEWEWMSAVAVR